MSAGLFPERLRALRQSRYLTQAALAQQLGLVHQGHISNLEAGRKAPSIDLVLRIADLFGVTTDYLLRGQDNTPDAIENANMQNSTSHLLRLFGAKLRYLRSQKNVLQVDLARELGLARQGYVSNLETGRTDPSLDLVIRVSNYFDVPTDYFLRDSIPIESVDI